MDGAGSLATKARESVQRPEIPSCFFLLLRILSVPSPQNGRVLFGSGSLESLHLTASFGAPGCDFRLVARPSEDKTTEELSGALQELQKEAAWKKLEGAPSRCRKVPCLAGLEAFWEDHFSGA